MFKIISELFLGLVIPSFKFLSFSGVTKFQRNLRRTLFVSFAVFIYYFNCISFAIRLSGRKVAIKLID